MRLSRFDVDRMLGGTPCVCGVIEAGTWHPECYAGLSREQIAKGYDRAYRHARQYLRAQSAQKASDVLRAAREAP